MASKRDIRVVGARSHNLRDLSCTIARGSLTVVSGVSGSGKSTLAFDTLFAEGQRRYIESLSAYARQFLQKMNRPDVERIENLPPAIAIEQRNRVRNARSTVGTLTEIHDYLRLLFAKIGEITCPECGSAVQRDSVFTVKQVLLAEHAGEKCRVIFETPKNGLEIFRERFLRDGFRKVLVQKAKKTVEIKSLEDESVLNEKWMGIILDQIVISAERPDRLVEALELGFTKGQGMCSLFFADQKGDKAWRRFFGRLRCNRCERDFPDLSPVQFSFNNPLGACPTCQGFGRETGIDWDRVIPDPYLTLKQGAIDPFTKPAYSECQNDLQLACKRLKIPMNRPWKDLSPVHQKIVQEGEGKWYGVKGFFDWLAGKRYKTHVRIFVARYRGYSVCQTCAGKRLRPESLAVRIGQNNINDVCSLAVRDLRPWFENLPLTKEMTAVSMPILREVRNRLQYLQDVGLGYLTLARQARTLSGGEAQRIALASALGSNLTDTLYVLDEPSIGLHPRDLLRLMGVLFKLRNLGNTIVLVEHELRVLEHADRIIDLGPQAGHLGGNLVFEGTYTDLLRHSKSLTAKFLRRKSIETPLARRRSPQNWIGVGGATMHNLCGVNVDFPLGVLVGISGVSGAGKSSLVHHVLYQSFREFRRQRSEFAAARVSEITGLENIGDMVLMDQSPVGKSLRSNTATYIGFYASIRQVFASTKKSRRLGLTPGSFSFNVAGGRCETCCGVGSITVDMQFLEDVIVTCEACQGKRFSPKVLGVDFHGKNIVDVLEMTAAEALAFFRAHAGRKDIVAGLEMLRDVGLDYLSLGQTTSTISGGEAQRLKLAKHILEGKARNLVYLFDEPTTGLHAYDIDKLLQVYERLVNEGNTVVVIEHNLDLLYRCDFLIDLGPEGGDQGGHIVATGSPETVMEVMESHTGSFLREYVKGIA